MPDRHICLGHPHYGTGEKAMETKKLCSLHYKLGGILGDMVMIIDKAQTAYDGKSNKWQDSDRGQAESNRILKLETAIIQVEGAILFLDQIIASEDD
jgi:hypothetical protein